MNPTEDDVLSILTKEFSLSTKEAAGLIRDHRHDCQCTRIACDVLQLVRLRLHKNGAKP